MRLTLKGTYKMTFGEHLMAMAAWAGISAAVSWLFYDNMLFLVLGWFIYPLFYRQLKKYTEKKYRWKMLMEFKEVMISIYSSLSAGVTVEESLQRAWKDVTGEGKKDFCMGQELELVSRKMERNIPLSQCLEEMAERCGEEDIENFTQILILGKRQGGNLAGMVRDNVEKIQRRIEMSYEIEGMIGAKRKEFGFMCLMPLGILLYMKCFSHEFMSVLYGNAQGAVLMSMCLGIYAAAIVLGLRILRQAEG